MRLKRIILTPPQGNPLPIYVETIGFNPEQEKIERENGYPYYHWLQTISGKGVFTIDGQEHLLPQNSGMLIRPNVSHSYRAISNKWQTAYITFNGPIIGELISYTGLKLDAIYQWEKHNPIETILIRWIERMDQPGDVFGTQASTNIYQFLLMLNSYARTQKPVVSENLAKIQQLITWMHKNISNPNIGLEDFASYLKLSPRSLNGMFREMFSTSPYAYFIDLRLRVAKQLLIESKHLSVKEVANHVGFRSPSHFVATFRKLFGITPDQFRQLH
ncbi:AraC family transcriptional regulator [Aquibacillus salsiterrae]|uniref:AraC family transcriptional regulator n=1 Tax=Aquibacillus salsiterrae TaxID=2950439 RepID=A0A9X3WFD3_9BACI|nr:AraC family transcriptional regulator [Aquibacillus salsiterrae]MDC3416026.1 AraC family transcriptional regulator [Aquibacillus salsiterrae]